MNGHIEVITSKRGIKYLSHGQYASVIFPARFALRKKIPENWQFKVMHLFMEFRAIIFFLAGKSSAFVHGMQHFKKFELLLLCGLL